MMRRGFAGWSAALAVALTMTAPAFAEVQNVKVSGSVNVKAVSKDNFDLRKTTVGTTTNNDKLEAYLQTTELRVDADLTDNVSSAVQLANQRFWDADNAASNDIDLDLAYVTIKELVYSPLTLTVGRQDINFGTGFVVSNVALLRDPNTTFGAGASATTTTVHGTQLQEFSTHNGYDAIRATLDYAPLTLDYVLAKIQERGEGGHDQDLMGLNANWKGAPVQALNGEAELYWFWKNDKNAGFTIHDTARTYEKNQVHTMGARTAIEAIKSLWLNFEVAGQLGEVEDTVLVAGQQSQRRNRRALAALATATYTFTDTRWTPMVGAGWAYYSGERAGQSPGGDRDDIHTWDPMFRGLGHGAISDYFAGNDSGYGYYTTFDPNDTDGGTNRHHFHIDVGAKPLPDVSLAARYLHVRFAEEPVAGRGRHAGDEVDLSAKWDYTEDVQVGLLGAAFLPGKYYDGASAATRGANTAWEVIGDLTVKF